MRVTTLALTLALLAGVAPAQDQSWEQQLRPLLDRYTDDAGPRRLDRAIEILLRRLELEPTDGRARLELARLELARGNLGAALTSADAAIAAFQAARTVRDAEHEERVKRFEEKGQEPPPHPGDLEREQRVAACAVGYLAAHWQLQDQLAALQTEEEKKRFFAEHPEGLVQVERRHRTLQDAAGGELEVAGAALRDERARRDLLRSLARPEGLPRLGELPPPLAQTDLQGKPLHLHELRGKVVLVLFWSTELADSAQVALEVDAVYRELRPRGFEVLAISLDTKADALRAFVESKGLEWRHACSEKGWQSSDAKAWGVRTVPSGALIDHAGRVRFVDPWGPDLRLAIVDLLDRRDGGGRR